MRPEVKNQIDQKLRQYWRLLHSLFPTDAEPTLKRAEDGVEERHGRIVRRSSPT